MARDARLDFLARYPCTVLNDHGDMRLDLDPDDPRIPPLSRVRLWLGLPGCTVKVRRGARVLLGFEGGDPDKPFAELFQVGSVERLTVQADSITLDGNVNLGGQVGAQGVLTEQKPVTWVFTNPVIPGVPVTATAQLGGSGKVKAV
jgi:hypothetical protein